MSRDAAAQADQNAQQSRQFAGQANQDATQIGNWLQPTLATQYSNPQGFGQDWLDSSKAEAGQIAGSKAATTKNNLDLMAGRTGNSAGFAPAEDQAMRESQSGLANSILGIDSTNAEAKAVQQSQALSGMEGMYGQNLGAETGNMNSSNNAVNIANAQPGWFQSLLGLGNTGANINASRNG